MTGVWYFVRAKFKAEVFMWQGIGETNKVLGDIFMVYSSEIFDTALCKLQSTETKERKKAASIFMRAACAETGTKNTKPIKEWFILNVDSYLSAIKKETNPEIIWIHLYTLQSFCEKYILYSHLFRIDSDVITDDNVQRFEEKSKEYVRFLLTKCKHPQVLQGIASFFWRYEEPFVWDIFIEVLKKKRDKLTLSHIGIAIRQCYNLSQENNRNDYISESQLKELLEVLESKKILQREAELLKSM